MTSGVDQPRVGNAMAIALIEKQNGELEFAGGGEVERQNFQLMSRCGDRDC